MTKNVFSEELILQHDKLSTLGMLSAGLIHEINNPLAYVLANLHFLSREILELEAQLRQGTKAMVEAKPLLLEWAGVVSESVEGVQHIGRLIQDMKGFTRNEASQEEWFELQEVVDSSLRIVWHELKHRVLVEKHFDFVLPCLRGNPSQLQQVFVNLLMNAAQAMDMPAGELGKVDIILSRQAEGISAEVRDNGRGIPAEHMDKLFNPFFTSKPSGTGTGLGLFICKQLVRGHGGRLHFESCVGEGTSAHIWLPVQHSKKCTEELDINPAPRNGTT